MVNGESSVFNLRLSMVTAVSLVNLRLSIISAVSLVLESRWSVQCPLSQWLWWGSLWPSSLMDTGQHSVHSHRASFLRVLGGHC